MRLFSLSIFALLLMGCPLSSNDAPTITEAEAPKWDFEKFMQREEKKVSRITVKHVLIAHVDAERSTATRTPAEAKALALELYKRAQEGEDFESLVQMYSDDTGKTPYTMVMTPARADRRSGEFQRATMALAFGDVGWRLDVGEIEMSDYDLKNSPFGYHIIKRIK